MHVVLNRYSSRIFRLNYLFNKEAVALVPLQIKEKYDLAVTEGDLLPEVIFIEDYTLPSLVSEIRKLSKNNNIESVTTLCEEDVDWAGFLNDHFAKKNTTSVSNLLFKDKYLMRSFLYGIVNQPYFRLLESKKDLELFWKNSKKDIAVIKPRNGAACVGIKKITIDTEVESNFYDGSYLIEEFINFTGMITCDGYSVGASIKRFYVHENVEPLLDSLKNKGYYLLRTSKLYYENYEMIESAFLNCEIVLEEFSVEAEVTPFHFEWFYDLENHQLTLCEVGKRFGGGYIPKLINDVYGTDILYEYWEILTKNSVPKVLEGVAVIDIPKKISATFALYKKSGYVNKVPRIEGIEWAQKIYLNLNKGDLVDASESIIDNSMLVQFISDSENDFLEKLNKIISLSTEIEYL
ncbi:TPA: carboxylate--amine ligase [Streptococcus suis]